MAYQPSEKKSVELPVVAFAKDLGIEVLKVNPLWHAGWPDRVFFVPGGKPLIIEFKRPGGKLRPVQVRKIEKLKRDGYDVQVCDSAEEGKALVRARLAAHSVHEAGDQVASRTPVRRPVPRSGAAKD